MMTAGMLVVVFALSVAINPALPGARSGCDELAASMSGVPTGRTYLAVYVISGLGSALVGVMLSG